MDFYELINYRRSIRAYEKKEVPEEKVTKILEAARLAPSAANKQPWHFIVIKDKATREKFKDAYSPEWFHTAPVIIGICGNPKQAWVRKYDNKNYFDVDLAICFDHLTLAAANEGLGTCWIGAFKPEKVKEILNLPDEIQAVAFTPLGFPAEKGKEKVRKALSDIVHLDKW